MRIGIYGGTFSPVHNGHIAAARAFMEQMWLDILYVIPTGVSPHKQMDGDANNEDRLTMCRLAFEGNMDGVIVSDLEMKREGKSYTVDTLRELYREGDRLFLLCGTDMMLTLDKWREPEEIFRLCYPVYVRRESDSELDAVIVEKLKEYKEKFGKNVMRLVTDPVEISSSEIRKRIASGDDVSELVPSDVAEYIFKKGLYKNEQ
jgi:nicotinate-nucleotide adenylyltransferase